MNRIANANRFGRTEIGMESRAEKGSLVWWVFGSWDIALIEGMVFLDLGVVWCGCLSVNREIEDEKKMFQVEVGLLRWYSLYFIFVSNFMSVYSYVYSSCIYLLENWK